MPSAVFPSVSRTPRRGGPYAGARARQLGRTGSAWRSTRTGDRTNRARPRRLGRRTDPCDVASRVADDRWLRQWFSTDGFTGQADRYRTAVQRASGPCDRRRPVDIAAGAVAEREGDTFRLAALIWRSPNGRDWTLVGSIPLAPPEKGIGPIGELAAGPGGVILTWVYPGDPELAPSTGARTGNLAARRQGDLRTSAGCVLAVWGETLSTAGS